jgi:hypothetical protein
MSGSKIFSSNRSNSCSPCDGATGLKEFALAFSASMIPEVVSPADGARVSCAKLDAQLSVIVVHIAIVRKTFLVIIVYLLQ